MLLASLLALAAARLEAQPVPQPVRVLIVFGVTPEAPAIAQFTQRLRLTLRNAVASPVEFYEEYLDLDRFPGLSPHLANYFADKYRGFRVDVIVAVGSIALQFATDRLRPLLPEAPVVFAMTVESAMSASTLPPNVTGRFAPLPFTQILTMAWGLQPDAEQLVLIAGLASIDSIALSVALNAASALPKLEVVVIRELTYADMLAKVQRLSPKSIIVVAYYRRDQRGQMFVPGEVISAIARAAPAPVYTYSRNLIGEGALGGAVTNPEEEGIRAGELVMRVLRRRPGEPLPAPVLASTVFTADWRQLRRFDLPADRLPPGTEILFRASGVWERYRAPIFAASIVIVAQFALIALLLIERKRRMRAQHAVEEQAVYEQTIADLTTDAVRHAPEEAPRALEDALARVARYSGATRAVLVQYADVPTRPSTRLHWPYSTQYTNRTDTRRLKSEYSATIDSGLLIPLVADGTPIGALELYRPDVRQEWSPQLIGRLDAAGELIAGAMARSRAARTIRQGEELNRAVLASMSTLIAILDSNGVIIRVNDAWRELAQRAAVAANRDAFVGENYLDECARAAERGCEEARDIRDGILSVLRRQATGFRHQFHCAPDERWYELAVDRLEHIEGGAIVTHLDITERRQAEIRAEETRRQIAHMGRVALVGELAAAVSHELRQPLAAIRANAEAGALLLSREPADLQEANRIFQDIVLDDIRAAEIIDHIRMLLRKDAPTTTTVDLNEICRQAVHLLQRDAVLRRTRLELALEPHAVSVSGDPVQLQQVVLNLALNALDSASSSTDDPAVTVSTTVRGGEVEISVRDTGPGLPPDVQGHLFESFFSTKKQGLGMGLVIVRSIVERHNGRVRAENDGSRGAVFRVMLPTS
ncbi:MAG TPA: ATP-binding protein [Gemmatimonadaceae bacterium]|nr:ATP-binding protein [Gemmatimonadaceae bacterium]